MFTIFAFVAIFGVIIWYWAKVVLASLETGDLNLPYKTRKTEFCKYL